MAGYTCPYCGGTDIEPAEFIDIGVGVQQVTPYVCHTCGHVEGQCVHDECLDDCPQRAYCPSGEPEPR